MAAGPTAAVPARVAGLLAAALDRAPSEDEVRELFGLCVGDPAALDALCVAAVAVRDRELGERAEVEAAFNAVTPCLLDPLCAYCPYWRGGANEPMSAADVVAGVRLLHDESDVRQFHLSGGSRRDGVSNGMVAVVEAIRAAGFDDMQVVVNCGAGFSDAELAHLAELKVKRVFSVVETCDPALFARVKPGDDLDEKLAFARRVAATGMQVGSGLMAGLPEPAEAAAAYARTLAELARLPGLTAVYVSKFRPAPGIALARKPACALDEARAVVALARLVLRGVHIRAAAGWSAAEHEAARAAGAGSIEVARSFSKRPGSCWGGR